MEIAVVFVDFFSGGQCYATQVFPKKMFSNPSVWKIQEACPKIYGSFPQLVSVGYHPMT